MGGGAQTPLDFLYRKCAKIIPLCEKKCRLEVEGNYRFVSFLSYMYKILDKYLGENQLVY